MSDHRKTIILFSCFYEPFISGAERFVKEVVERLSDRYRFVIITAKLDKNLEKFVEKEGYQIHRVGFGKRSDKWLYPILAPLHALSHKPDLVHAVMESYAGVALWIFSFLSNKPRILTLQSGDLDDETKQEKIPNWLWRKIHKNPNHITAISNFLKNRAVKLGANENEISVIPNGVDLNKFSVQEETAQKAPYRIICVGRLSWEKGHEYLIRALPKIREEFPSAHLVLVGDGPLKDDLRGLVFSLNLQNHVEFKGLLPHKFVVEEMKKSSVFICPSLAEGLGIVFIEAQACGMPVIGTNVGGIPDVIQSGNNGLLIPPRNTGAIVDAIKKIFKDQHLTNYLVLNARQNSLKFEWRNISEQVSDVYLGHLSC